MKKEREMTFNKLICFILKHWSQWLITGIIMSLGICFLQIYRVSNNNSEENNNISENTGVNSTTQLKIDEYLNKIKLAEEQIQVLEINLDKQKHYNETSKVMNLDETNVAFNRTSYYIDNNFTINFQGTTQKKDNVNSILKSYDSIINNIAKNNILKEDQTLTKTDIDILIQTVIDNESGIFDLQILGNSEDEVNAYKNKIEQVMNSSIVDFTYLYGDHSVKVISSINGIEENDIIKKYKEKQFKNLNNLEDTLMQKKTDVLNYQDAINSLGGDKNGQALPSAADIKGIAVSKSQINIKFIFGYLFLGFLLGVCLVWLKLIIQLIISSKVQSINEIEEIYNIPILGTMIIEENKINRFVDKITKNKLIRAGYLIEKGTMLSERISDIICKKDVNKLIFVSSDKNIPINLEQKVKKLDTEYIDKRIYHFLNNTEDYRKLNNEVGVILLVLMGHTDFNIIDIEIKELNRKEVPIVGYIII